MSAQTITDALSAEEVAFAKVTDALRDAPSWMRASICRHALNTLVAEDQDRAAKDAANARDYWVLKATPGPVEPRQDPTEPDLHRWVLVFDDGREYVSWGRHDAYRDRSSVHGVVEDWGHGLPRFRRRSRTAKRQEQEPSA